MKTKNYVSELEERNTQICKEVVEEYHQNHTYYGEGIFVCGDMANDVWDILKTKGINAKIRIGNVDKIMQSYLNLIMLGFQQRYPQIIGYL